MVMLAKVALVSAVALLGWAFQATRPPPPAILGGLGGPPVTSSRIQLKDGRHLAYREAGVARETAKYKVIFFHGFGSTKESGFPVSQELVEELGIYLLFFDRAGYGDSDANPKRSLKSDATDVEELADALQLGEKLYVVGTSMGAYTVWSCLNYIPHRLAGAALVVPAVNYWWPLPANVSASAYGKLHVADRRTFWIAHNMPWLFYEWMTQKWFRISPIVSGQREAFTDQDWEILTELQRKQLESGQVDQTSNLAFLKHQAKFGILNTWIELIPAKQHSRGSTNRCAATRRSCSVHGSSTLRRSRTRSPTARASSASGKGTRTRSFESRYSATWRSSFHGYGTMSTLKVGTCSYSWMRWETGSSGSLCSARSRKVFRAQARI